MKNVIRKFSSLLIIGCEINQEVDGCCCTEISYEEVIKRYEEICSE